MTWAINSASISNGQPLVARRDGFTLIELMLVMALLVVAISTTAPVLSRFFHGRTLDSEARRLLSLTRAGQSRAVSEGVPTLLWIDAAQGEYGLELESAPRLGDPKAEDFTVADGLRVDAVNAAPIAIGRQKLPAVRFLPDGTMDDSSPSALRVAAADGSVLWLVQETNHMTYAIQTVNQ
ncbi:MAG TPA: prepilin-type N-terminal cleavage/methylation domain-containing protein [Verrucomicrobiae bacterium]|nr:prepilin-type N-terminal cleavage/methylation domain-containing protein [Verrucomicrobiae bacterium]